MNSGSDGMELAATLAANDPDPEVVVGVVEALAFRRGDRHVNRIMQAVPDGVWKVLGKQDYPIASRMRSSMPALQPSARQRATRETDPLRLLGRIADERPADAEARITRLLETVEVQAKDMNFAHAIAHAYPEYPGAVAAALVGRIAANLPLPVSRRRLSQRGPATRYWTGARRCSTRTTTKDDLMLRRR